MAAPEALREAIRARVFPRTLDLGAAAAARAVVAGGGAAVQGIVFFGSRKTGARPDAWSAHDLVVLTRDHAGFYRALRQAGIVRRSASLLAVLDRLLPPNQIAVPFRLDDGSPGRAKCAVLTLEAFERETSASRHDHFLVGRLFQPTELLYTEDAAVEERILEALTRVHALSYEWVRPWLPERFDVGEYCRQLLRVSFSAEIRPEPEGRADALWAVQEPYLRPVYTVLLESLAAQGELSPAEAGTFSLRRPITTMERLRLAIYFRWSMVRATVRWAKHILTFEDWLEFILRKAQRHTGREIVLTPRERRLPLIFLWPRVIQYLRKRDR